MATAARDKFLASMKDLLNSGKFSDLTITCGPDTYQVHKNIVCTGCSFFERAEGFAAGWEAAESKIDLPADEPAIINLFIQFLYEAEYSPTFQPAPLSTSLLAHTCYHRNYCNQRLCNHHTCSLGCCSSFICEKCRYEQKIPIGDSSQLLIHCKVYEVGDKYDVPGLKELAREKFKLSCCAYWGTDEFAVAAEYAYSTTPEKDEGLRHSIYETLSTHRDIIKKSEIKNFLQKRLELMYRLLA